jgi:transcription initiation factor TFIIE subunit alpha
MRLTKKLISEVVSNAVGIEAVDMALYLKGKTDVSELVVAKDMNMTIQEARAMLYKLYEANLTRFERKRDKHKGWHISHWDFLDDNIIKLYKSQQMDKISSLKNRLSREQKNEFYMCNHACSRVEFEKAVELNFKCPECGVLMNPVDNRRTIEVINSKLKELESSLE